MIKINNKKLLKWNVLGIIAVAMGTTATVVSAHRYTQEVTRAFNAINTTNDANPISNIQLDGTSSYGVPEDYQQNNTGISNWDKFDDSIDKNVDEIIAKNCLKTGKSLTAADQLLLTNIKQQIKDQFDYLTNNTTNSMSIGKKTFTYNYLQLNYHPELITQIRKGDLTLTDINENLHDAEVSIPQKSLNFTTLDNGSTILNGFDFKHNYFTKTLAALIASSNVLYIPNSVKGIADYAFDGIFSQNGEMPQIDTIEFQAGANVDIGIAAFRGCDNIEKIIFDGEGTSKAEIHNVSDNSFASCKNLSTPMTYHAMGIDGQALNTNNENGVTIDPIPTATFIGCTSLPSIKVIFDNVDSANGTKTYQIGESEFSSCDVLDSVNLSQGLTKLNADAFNECKTLKGEVLLPDTVVEFGNSVFANCTSLTSINFPTSLTTIGDDAFNGCIGLNGSLYIPNSITSIGSQAFFGTNFVLHDEYYTSTNTFFSHKWCLGATYLFQDNHPVVSGSADDIKDVNIETNTYGIANGAFRSLNKLSTVTVADTNLAYIGDYAFANDEWLNFGLTYPQKDWTPEHVSTLAYFDSPCGNPEFKAQVINDILGIVKGKAPTGSESVSRSFNNHRVASNTIIIVTTILAVVFLAAATALIIFGLKELLSAQGEGGGDINIRFDAENPADENPLNNEINDNVSDSNDSDFNADDVHNNEPGDDSDSSSDSDNDSDNNSDNNDFELGGLNWQDNTINPFGSPFAAQDRCFLKGIPSLESNGAYSADNNAPVIGKILANYSASNKNGRYGLAGLCLGMISFAVAAILLIIGLLLTAWDIYDAVAYAGHVRPALTDYENMANDVKNTYDVNQGHIIDWIKNKKNELNKKSKYVRNGLGPKIIEAFTGKTKLDIDHIQAFIDYYSHNELYK